MSHGSKNFNVSRASRKTHSVCGVTAGMFSPLTSIEIVAFVAKKIDAHCSLTCASAECLCVPPAVPSDLRMLWELT